MISKSPSRLTTVLFASGLTNATRPPGPVEVFTNHSNDVVTRPGACCGDVGLSLDAELRAAAERPWNVTAGLAVGREV
jgi:hypothetical protein